MSLPWTAFLTRPTYRIRAISIPVPTARQANFFDHQNSGARWIDDRFRNKDAAQGFAYPIFILERLINATEIIRLAGFDPYRYRGRHGQSI
jgi:hypothetical protein